MNQTTSDVEVEVTYLGYPQRVHEYLMHIDESLAKTIEEARARVTHEMIKRWGLNGAIKEIHTHKYSTGWSVFVRVADKALGACPQAYADPQTTSIPQPK